MTALVDTIRKQQQEIVLKWTQELCEALLKDFQRQSIERSTLSLLMCDKDEDHSIKYYQERIAEAERGENLYKFYPESGRKYHKIMMECDDGVLTVFMPLLIGRLVKFTRQHHGKHLQKMYATTCD